MPRLEWPTIPNTASSPQSQSTSTTWSIRLVDRLVGGHLDLDGRVVAVDRPHGVGRGRVAEARAAARPVLRVVLVGVPRADQPAVVELAVAQRAALVRAAVVERRPGAVLAVHDAHRPVPGHHRGDPP